MIHEVRRRFALIRELSDGTCRPCTVSEMAALKDGEAPTRSPSVNPASAKRPRTPMLPALSPLGRPSLTLPPASSVGAEDTQTGEGPGKDLNAVQQHDAGGLPEQAAGTHASQQAVEASGAPGQQGSLPRLDSRGSKENALRPIQSAACAAQQGRGEAGAAKIGRPPNAKAQQADSEGTVTISGLDPGAEDTDTDDESVPTRKVCGCPLRPGLAACPCSLQCKQSQDFSLKQMTFPPAICLDSSRAHQCSIYCG